MSESVPVWCATAFVPTALYLTYAGAPAPADSLQRLAGRLAEAKQH